MSNSLAPECNDAKEYAARPPLLSPLRSSSVLDRLYDTCFLKWYSEKYLKGTEKNNDECAALFKDYQKCLAGALKEKGIDKLIEEAREDNKDNDARLVPDE
ncbi:hypothetical protein E4U58_006372 [Claviceps cyperi]|nr:hypothetical protein E4U58_006372 [Claviceps cyperi]